ncbi:MAG TPA: hypothetical protein EYP85_02570 [Armatimonadetes bacterium]|nr:hypothetical protein [Armatimonadota bacterium]
MTLGTKFIQALETFTGPADEVVLWEGDLALRARVRDADRLACVLDSLEMQGPPPTAFSDSALLVQQQAQALRERLIYLSEPLRLVEQVADWVQMRSFPPLSTAESIDYFELLLRGGNTLTLQRYTYDKTAGRRRPREFSLTKEAACRLVDDLAAVLQQEEHNSA